MFFPFRLFVAFCMMITLSSCAIFGFENQCEVIYEQNLELTEPPVVPTSTDTITTNP